MITGQQTWDLIKPDVKSIVEKLFISALSPALDQIVKDTKNPYDDAMMAMLKPILESAVKEQLGHL